MPLDLDAAATTLAGLFADAQAFIFQGTAPPVARGLERPFEVIFSTRVQAYRETLLGCALARMQDRTINIRLPYVKQGRNAYNGRTLDERVVNPFLQQNRVPSSRGPYLSTFRRSVRFNETTRQGACSTRPAMTLSLRSLLPWKA